MSKLLIISFDAIPSGEWDTLSSYPNVSAFARLAALTLDARSVHLSNTYTVHCSVATGRPPGEHGVISNVEPFPKKRPRWRTAASGIRAKTLWQAAREAGLSAASVLWPCTAGSRDIRWNVPELPPEPGQNQAFATIMAGSKLMLIRFALKYAKLMDGMEQPALDNFAAACSVDILKRKRPDLTLVHLTAFDTLCHRYGRDPKKLKPAFKSLDENLGRLLDAAEPETSVIIFSDHAQLNIHTVLTPNDLLTDMGLLKRLERETPSGEIYAPGEYGCFFECCGGSAFFYAGGLPAETVGRIRAAIADSEGFNRFFTPEEMRECGRDGGLNGKDERLKAAFGYAVKPGYMTDAYKSEYKGNHGYPPDTPDYGVFYAVKGGRGVVLPDDFSPGSVRRGGSLLDIAPLAARILGLNMGPQPLQ